MSLHTHALVFAVGVALLAGCAPQSTPAPSIDVTTTPTASATPTPTPSIDPQGPDGAVVRFYEVLDLIASSDTERLDRFAEVATGAMYEKTYLTYQRYRVLGVRQSGRMKVEQVQIDRAKDPVTVRFCLDTSGMDLKDFQGKSIIGVDSPRRVIHEMTVIHDAGVPKIASDSAVETC